MSNAAVRFGGALLVCAVLAACQDRASAPQPAPATATSTESTPAIALAEVPAPAAASPGHAPSALAFSGFGAAAFGSDEEAVRMSWGRPLRAAAPAPGASCHYLLTDPRPAQGRGIAFMFEDGKFTRYDVDVADQPAPGNIRVGDSLDSVLAAFPGRTQLRPDKYIEGGHTVSVGDPSHPDARLVFQADAAGKILGWRMGVLPQVEYVEGCG